MKGGEGKISVQCSGRREAGQNRCSVFRKAGGRENKPSVLRKAGAKTGKERVLQDRRS